MKAIHILKVAQTGQILWEIGTPIMKIMIKLLN